MREAALRVRTLSSAGRGPGVFVFDRGGVRAVDRAAVEDFGVPGVVLMENAAAGLARVCVERLPPGGDALALLLCGPGNNGGDGYACARRLLNAGVRVAVLALGEPKAGSDAAVNLHALRAMRGPAAEVRTLRTEERTTAGEALDAMLGALGAPALLVDAMLGTGLDRPLREPFASAVEWVNARRGTAAVVAADLPTGLDCDSGEALGGLAVRADATVTFAGLKRGFFSVGARDRLGEVWIADIGAPAELLARHGGRPAPGSVQVVG